MARLRNCREDVRTDGAETATQAGCISVLEEKIRTHQAEYRTDIARLGERMAEWREDMAKRETRLPHAVPGLVSFAVVAIGILIRLPPPG